MFYKKQGFPEENEIVICTVKKVLPNSVFANLDEYGKEGMMHISEVSPGRIRNIRDFVVEGRTIICKVLRVNKVKGYIDLSLRRVNQAQKINKLKEYKQEQKSEKILDIAAKELNLSLQQIYEEIGNKIIEEYGSLTSFFRDVSLGKASLTELKTPPKIDKVLTRLIKERIKPPEIKISGTLKLQSNASNGIEIIKDSLKKLKQNNVTITYLGAPRYKISVISNNYKDAELLLKKTTEDIINDIKKNQGYASFTRDE